jgi:hypothetical protein
MGKSGKEQVIMRDARKCDIDIKERAIGLACFVCFAAPVLLSGAFVSANAGYNDNHHCDDNCCVACIQICTAVVGILGQAGADAIPQPPAFENYYAVSAIAKITLPQTDIFSPVTLHVRLNN